MSSGWLSSEWAENGGRGGSEQGIERGLSACFFSGDMLVGGLCGRGDDVLRKGEFREGGFKGLIRRLGVNSGMVS